MLICLYPADTSSDCCAYTGGKTTSKPRAWSSSSSTRTSPTTCRSCGTPSSTGSQPRCVPPSAEWSVLRQVLTDRVLVAAAQKTIYDSWVIGCFNVFFTSLPPLCYGVFERDLRDETIDKYPQLYRRLQKGQLFTPLTFLSWLADAVWESLGTDSLRPIPSHFPCCALTPLKSAIFLPSHSGVLRRILHVPERRAAERWRNVGLVVVWHLRGDVHYHVHQLPPVPLHQVRIYSPPPLMRETALTSTSHRSSLSGAVNGTGSRMSSTG